MPRYPATYPQNALPAAHALMYSSMNTACARARTTSRPFRRKSAPCRNTLPTAAGGLFCRPRKLARALPKCYIEKLTNETPAALRKARRRRCADSHNAVGVCARTSHRNRSSGRRSVRRSPLPISTVITNPMARSLSIMAGVGLRAACGQLSFISRAEAILTSPFHRTKPRWQYRPWMLTGTAQPTSSSSSLSLTSVSRSG